MSLIKSISGIRGTIGGNPGEGLTPLDIVKFTAAYASWVGAHAETGKKCVVMGRDARLSGDMVARLVSSTLCSMGFDVIIIRLATRYNRTAVTFHPAQVALF
jgi:phosphomannomutase